jgi:hypothetical protein
MSAVFSEAELETLSVEIDRQLQELRQSEGVVMRGDEHQTKGALVKQQETIESLTKEPMDSFSRHHRFRFYQSSTNKRIRIHQSK